MENDRFNDLAALLNASFDNTRREMILGGVIQDETAREILYAASFPGLRETIQTRVPFDTSSNLLVGVSGSHLRILEMEGISLVRSSARLAAALANVSGGRLPICLTGRIEAETGSASSCLNLLIQRSDDSWQMIVQPSGIPHGRVEIWKDGDLLRNLPVENLARRPLRELEPGSNISLRFEGAETGASVILAEFEFSRLDWLAICLTNVLTGNLREAIQVLKHSLPDEILGEGILRRVESWLRATCAATRSVNAVLCPLPALRSVDPRNEDRLSMFLPVWNGILDCWPEAGGMPNPWRESQEPVLIEEPKVPEEVMSLVDAAVQAGGGSEPYSMDSLDSRVLEGWAAIEGWRLLAERDYVAALEKFTSIPLSSERDPFGLEMGAHLSRHLLNVETNEPFEKELSSDSVWRRIFEGIL